MKYVAMLTLLVPSLALAHGPRNFSHDSWMTGGYHWFWPVLIIAVIGIGIGYLLGRQRSARDPGTYDQQ